MKDKMEKNMFLRGKVWNFRMNLNHNFPDDRIGMNFNICFLTVVVFEINKF